MSSVSGSRSPLPSSSVVHRREDICDRFEAACKADQRPRIEAYLNEAAAQERSPLLRELLGLELDYRKRRGERPSPQEYEVRFPEYAQLIAAVFSEVSASQLSDEQGRVPNSSVSDATSSSPLERLRASDSEAWRRLVRLYSPLVYGWCRRGGLRAEDAADVLQEVFLAVSLHIATFRRDRASDTFRGWLWTITQNKVRDHFRRSGVEPEATGGTDMQKRLAELPAVPAGDPAAGGDPCSAARDAPDEISQLLRRALDLIRGEFEDRTWQAFWQTTVDGRLPADVAADLGLSANAVYKAKSRVLRRLREELHDLVD